jgi:hypothetical protein
MEIINYNASLYWQLQQSEKLERRLREQNLYLNSALEELRDNPNIEGVYRGIEIPKDWHFDTPSFQRKLINNFRGNPLLNSAFNGELSLEETLAGLQNKIKGVCRRLLPQRVDEEHNTKVLQIEELIGGELSYLEKKGFAHIDNPLTPATYGFVAGVGFVAYIDATLGDVQAIEYPAVGLMFAGLFSLCGVLGMINRVGINPNFGEDFFSQEGDLARARYLDNKISKLYPKKTRPKYIQLQEAKG